MGMARSAAQQGEVIAADVQLCPKVKAIRTDFAGCQ